MKKILIVGGGAMGSAFSIPCIDNKNKVFITEPYSKIFIRDLSSKNNSQCKCAPLSFCSAPEEVPVLPDSPMISPALTICPAIIPSLIEERCE